MCGIAGIWNYRGSRPAEELVGDMLEAMQHRGPDSRGSASFAGGATGMVRLALVDPTPRGEQPMWSPCGKVAVVFNGEIYNFHEERKRLEARGHSFCSSTDTEVLLHSYLDCGEEFVHHMRGMFAVAIFDWRNSSTESPPTVILARGPLGIKPLYVAQVGPHGETVVFSSELRSLLASGLVPRRIDSAGVRDYLQYGFVLQPRTMIEGVRMLEPATIERYEPGKPRTARRYWRVPAYRPRNESFNEAAERLRAELEESVRLHAFADVPVGAFLSGGIDSTSIVALMRKHVSELRTYTFHFPEFPDADESEPAALTAKIFDCRHTTVDVTGADVRRLLPTFADEIDQPSFDGLNSWFVSRRAAEDVKAVVSGLGGDEWFAGYPVTSRMLRRTMHLWRRTGSVAGWAADRLRGFVADGSLRRRLDGLAARRSALSLWMQPHTVFEPPEVAALTGTGFVDGGLRRQAEEIRELIGIDFAGETAVGMSCLLDVYVFEMCQLLRDADATSMSCSLELRVPFVDVKLAEFSRTCRDDYKLSLDGRHGSGSNGGAKQVLIKAVEDLLPQHLRKLPKRGFVLPLERWLQTDLRDLVDETCRPDVVKRRGLIDPRAVAPLFKERDSGSPHLLHPRLWSLMILELWSRAVLDRSFAPATHN
jgi:asparagine synthase (glutamine-hydrolysing)